MKRILVIEDHPLHIDILTQYLNRPDWDVLIERDGESGLATALASRPDLILLDLDIPRLPGVDVIDHLKQDSTTQHIPIVVMTAYAEIEAKRKAFDAGCDEFFAKPFDTHKLNHLIEHYLSDTALV